MSVIWLNDGLVQASDASISPFDHAVTVGDGIFETLQIVTDAQTGTPAAFAMGRHLRRLRRSADLLGLAPPDDALLRTAAAAVVAANPDTNRLRITMSAGLGPLGSGRYESAPTIIVAATAGAPHPPVADVALVPWTRNERGATAGAKTTSYAENVIALAAAKKAGAQEALLANTRGELCEGTGSNVFVVVDGRVVTPPLDSGCLAGITRELVLELIEVDEAPLPNDNLQSTDEAFLTSSLRNVQPIATIDGRPLGPPGVLTRAAMAAFDELLATTIDP